ncbi:Protein of unknown function [Pedobacter steynii]|uniref:DUF2851 domain-containing protein n=1 Tax=Pedobacter steynii TaxID=430522 RepID=A0A1G9MIW2_9SPHI|nr:DUF2851 family protein [Pedobacter steynii]NQX39591.1 DUF2851 family protein [Pedobacter steynii]SDL73817.1 Protein of unknown function [Pedobacter steynii]
MSFSENFLHFIWQFRLYKTLDLFCIEGEPLRIMNPGLHNKNAGPDFNHAKLSIGETTWAGDIEIHIKSSDWLLHGHQDDPAYDAVILHVVYQYDQPIYRKDGSRIPVFILEHLFPEHLLVHYHQLMNMINRFPCEKQIREIDPVIVSGFLSRMMVERFEQKSALVLDKLIRLTGDWERTFYHFMAKSFGFKVNEIPFELLADALPLQVLRKHLDNPVQVEALVFGQAGFLSGAFKDEYPRKLKKEYLFLQKKYGLKPIGVGAWRFLRMRPQNFPTLRLAQFCGLMVRSDRLFSRVLEIEALPDLVQHLGNLPVNPYWLNHYHFQKETKKVKLQLGKRSVYHLIINVISLFLFSYGKYADQPQLINRAIKFLEQMPAENNVIIDWYRDSGLIVESAFFSQALLQLNKYYCAQKKCLNCGIGIKILKK